MELQHLAPVVVIDLRTIPHRVRVFLEIAVDLVLGLLVVDEAVAFDHVQLLAERRAVHVEHRVAVDLYADGIDHQRVAFIAADGIAVP